MRDDMGDLAIRKETTAVATRKQGDSWHTPQSIADGWKLAETIAASGLAGQDATPAVVFAKMATGAELGISPMASLRALYAINHKLGIDASMQVALIRRSGTCAMWDVLESTPERCVLRVQRADGRPAEFMYDVAKAKTAELWGKRTRNGKTTAWITTPARMLRHRAETDAADALWQDVLWGMDTADKLRDDAMLSEDAQPQPPAPPMPSAPPAHKMLTREPAPRPVPPMPPAPPREEPRSRPAAVLAKNAPVARETAPPLSVPAQTRPEPTVESIREQQAQSLKTDVPRLGLKTARILVSMGASDVQTAAVIVRAEGRPAGMRTAAYEWLLAQLKPTVAPEPAVETYDDAPPAATAEVYEEAVPSITDRLAACEDRKEMVSMAGMILADALGDGDVGAADGDIAEMLGDTDIGKFDRYALAVMLDGILAELMED